MRRGDIITYMSGLGNCIVGVVVTEPDRYDAVGCRIWFRGAKQQALVRLFGYNGVEVIGNIEDIND